MIKGVSRFFGTPFIIQCRIVYGIKWYKKTIKILRLTFHRSLEHVLLYRALLR